MSQPSRHIPAIPRHFSVISAQTSSQHSAKAHTELEQDLRAAGFEPKEVAGKFGYEERAYLVPHQGTKEHREAIESLGRKHKQQAVLHSSGLQNELVFMDGQASHKGVGMTVGEHLTDYYLRLPTGHKARLQVKAPAKLRLLEHPNTYEWHEGHTQHHQDKDVVNKSEVLEKSAAKKIENDQAAGAGTPTFSPIASHFGTVTPGAKTNLKFYPDVHKFEPQIDKKIAGHGYQTYFAGGKYGKPDLANKNYNTGHLMVYDPTPASGGDFGDEAFTRTWRKSHELAHALTYPEINKLYGEGRRLGKLGVRTPREAERAVHWEWLAAHKQRDLLAEAGLHVHDHDFHRELNTVMADAVHRAVHGTFTEPADEGFHPSHEKIPLETSLRLVREHAQSQGLDHPEATRAQLQAKVRELKKRAHQITLKGAELLKSQAETCADCGGRALMCACYQGLTAPEMRLEKGQLRLHFDGAWDDEQIQSFTHDFKRRASYLLRKQIFGQKRQ
jgi:hypothetical protein